MNLYLIVLSAQIGRPYFGPQAFETYSGTEQSQSIGVEATTDYKVAEKKLEEGNQVFRLWAENGKPKIARLERKPAYRVEEAPVEEAQPEGAGSVILTTATIQSIGSGSW